VILEHPLPRGAPDPILEVKNFFRKVYGHTPTYTLKAPGRLELLGNHTDYNDGLVMSVAVDKYVCMAASPRSDGRVELASTAFPEPEKFSIGNFSKNPAAPWTDYVKGVLLELRKHNVHFSGFNAAIHGTVPMGAGMSSSAALEVATALMIRQLNPYTITETACTIPPRRNKRGGLRPLKPKEKLILARLCQTAENHFVGVNCGLLDQVSSLFGRAFHAVEMDCKYFSVETLPMIGEIALVMCGSGVRHAHAGGDYNALRQDCESAARSLGARSLRSVELPFLKAQRARLTERQFDCAYHVVGEIQRVVAAERALRAGDFVQFGQYMFQSHESSRGFLKNSTAELDLLVEIAREHSATLGARLTGGGFGGATINLVRRDQVEAFISFMAAQYQQKTGRVMRPMLCQIVDGAG
jgi:galactokinase